MKDVHGGEDLVEKVLVLLEAVRPDVVLVVAGEVAVGAGQALEPLEHHVGVELDRVGEPQLVVTVVVPPEVLLQSRPVFEVFFATGTISSRTQT